MTATRSQSKSSFLALQEQRGRDTVDQAAQIVRRVTGTIGATAGRAALIGLGLSMSGVAVAGSGLLIGVAAVATTYKIIRHPIQTALAVKNLFAGLAERVIQGAKEQLVRAEEKLIDSKNAQISQRLREIPGITPRQLAAVSTAVSTSLSTKYAAQKKAVEESWAASLPVKSVTHRCNIWLAGRSHKRFLAALKNVKAFADKYHSLYPDQCSGFTDGLIARMTDGKMSIVESLSLKLKMAVTGLRNKFILFAMKAVPDPFGDVAPSTSPKTV